MLDSAIRSEMVANHRFRHMRIQSRNKDTILILSIVHLLSSFIQRIITGSVVTATMTATATATTTTTATASLAIGLIPILP